jgi:hypothetical protein
VAGRAQQHQPGVVQHGFELASVVVLVGDHELTPVMMDQGGVGGQNRQQDVALVGLRAGQGGSQEALNLGAAPGVPLTTTRDWAAGYRVSISVAWSGFGRIPFRVGAGSGHDDLGDPDDEDCDGQQPFGGGQRPEVAVHLGGHGE